MVTVNQIKAGILDYAYQNILPQMEPVKQFLAGTAMGALSGKAEEMIRQAAKSPALLASGLISENGSVDLDGIYKAAMEQMQRQGSLPVNIPLIGTVVFKAEDVGALYRSIKAANV